MSNLVEEAKKAVAYAAVDKYVTDNMVFVISLFLS